MNQNPDDQLVKEISERINSVTLKSVLRKSVENGMDLIKSKTPVKWTGKVRASWTTEELSDGFRIKNTNVVSILLESGTRDHGAVTAKRLYIPLKPEAVMWSKGLRFGQDYILAKRVRGIRALNILGDSIPIIVEEAVGEFKKMATKI